MQTYNLIPSRNQITAERKMLRAAEPRKVLCQFGMLQPVPERKTDTVVFRRALPIDANAFGAPEVDANNYLMQEGVTPGARSIVYQDVQATLQQYGILTKLSSKVEMLYEDDVPADMTAKVGQHMASIEEMIAYGVVRGGTNVVFANGSARTGVNTVISLPKLRQCSRVLELAHADKVTSKLMPSVNFGTVAVEESYLVFHHTNLSADIRNLPGFTPVVEYGQSKPTHAREIGAVEEFRFLSSPYFRPFLQAASAATGTTAGTVLSNGQPNSGNAPDVYPVVIAAEEAWGNVALRGQGAVQPIYLPAKLITHANPSGQFGYVGANFWKTAVRLNENWMVRLEVAASAL